MAAGPAPRWPRRSPLRLRAPPRRATILDSVPALVQERPRASGQVLRRAPDNGRTRRRATGRPRARHPRGRRRTTPQAFPRRDSSRASSHRRTIILRFLASPTSRSALRRGRLDTQELAKVELARILADRGEAIGNLCRAQRVLISQPALDLTA